jgi:hypothetical protein
LLRGRATSRGRQHDRLVRAPDAGDPHVRCDERGLETGGTTYRASPRLHQVPAPALFLCAAATRRTPQGMVVPCPRRPTQVRWRTETTLSGRAGPAPGGPRHFPHPCGSDCAAVQPRCASWTWNHHAPRRAPCWPAAQPPARARGLVQRLPRPGPTVYPMSPGGGIQRTRLPRHGNGSDTAARHAAGPPGRRLRAQDAA